MSRNNRLWIIMADREQTKKTVAVIGSGMAGLVSAYLIQQDPKHRYEVQVFETVNHT